MTYNAFSIQWTTNPTGRIGLQRRRRSILEVGLRNTFPLPPLISPDKNPKAFAFANPGRLAKSAARSHDVCIEPDSQHLLTSADQREAPTCPSNRPNPRRTSSTTCHNRWTPRRRKDNTPQIPRQTIRKRNPLRPPRTHHSSNFEAATPDIRRMSQRTRSNGGHVKGGRHRAPDD